jgi:hypothetical protein
MKSAMNTTIDLMSVVSGTSTNTEGLTLFTRLSNEINAGHQIKLSLSAATAMSSSFMNSSFGELVDKYGIEKVREAIRLINYTPSHAQHIKSYLDMVASYKK